MTRLLVVADLHASAGPHDPFDADDAFARLLAERLQAAADDGVALELVVLGDLLDFLHVPAPTAAAALERIAAEHPRVFAALAEVAATGCSITIVPGNHDVALLVPAVQERFRELVGATDSGVVEFEPWIVHVPRLLYAEHGSQYHTLNAVGSMLDDAAFDRTLGSHLDLHAIAVAAAGSAGQRARLHLRLLAEALRSSRGRRRPAGDELRDYAEHLGLPEEAMRAIHGRAAVAPFAVARTAAGMLTRRPGASSPGYLHRSAAEIHRILSRHRHAVPFYVFAHTHLPERRRLEGEGTALYLNPGTWSRLSPRGTPAQPRPGYVEIDRGFEAGPPSARLLHWQGSAQPTAVARS